MAKAVLEGMTGRGFGRVVNIGSVNGQAGQYGQVNYAAANRAFTVSPKRWPRRERPTGSP